MCPICGAEEDHPTDKDKILVRGYKITDKEGNIWSQCLVCSGGYDKDLNWNEKSHDPEKGWFKERFI